MIVSASRKRRTRSGGGHISSPVIEWSMSAQPAPRARSSRPSEMWSIVSACLAKTAGLRKPVKVTIVPSRMRSVPVATATSNVQAS
jgi:hypothetical protein